MTKQEKLLLFVLACLNFTHVMDFMIMMPLGPQLSAFFNITPQQFAILVSAYSTSAGISGFLVAFIADRFPRKTIIFWCYVGFVIGTLACALAPTYGLLMAARIFAGIFGGVLGAQVMTIVSDTFAYERRARAMGVVMTAFAVASVVGIPLALRLTTMFSWHAPFWFIGLVGIVVIGLIWLYVPILDGHINSSNQTSPWQVLSAILKNPNQRRALLLTSVIMLGHFSIIPFISPCLVTNVGFSVKNLDLIYLVGGAATLITSPIVGRIADKKGKLPVFITFALLSTIPMFLITNMMPNTTMPLILLVAVIFFVFSNGRLIPTQAMVSSVVEPEQRGGFLAINTSVQLLMQGLAVYLAGLVIQKNDAGKLIHYNWVGYAAIVSILISIFIAKTIRINPQTK
jgi:MFS transporter, DHA1 family, inner membrane transport protein